MISGTVIVKDRLQTIAKCIDSFKWCDEIIVVDTGSKDGTLEYLKGLSNIKLYEYPFTDFSDVRNYGLSKCNGEWIFFLDSDEYLEEKYFEEVKGLTQSDADAWELIQCSFTNSDDYTLCPSIRLFRKGIEFRLPIHETIIYSAQEKGYKIGKINIPFMHTGYIEKKDSYKVPNEHPLADYYNHSGDPKRIENLLGSAINKNLKSYLLLILAEHYLNEGYVYKSIKLCEKSISIIKEQNLAYMLLSMIYVKVGLVDEAINQIVILINKNSKMVCNMFNDRFYTMETLKATLNELLEVKQKEQNYINNLNKEN